MKSDARYIPPPEDRIPALMADLVEFIVGEGDENDANIVPGNAEKSPVYKYTTLTEDDDWIMPSKGDLLTKTQQETIKNWINEGAKFGNWKVTTFNPDGTKK